MAEAGLLAPLVAALRDLLAWWQATQVRGMVIGGVAASLLGRPRVTRDVDGVVWLAEDQWAPFLAAAAPFGFVPRSADALAFARQARVLLMHHQASGIDVDIAFGALPFEEEALARAQVIEVSGLQVPLPTPEDLIVMKAVAHRPRDQADIAAIVDAQGKLNLRRVRQWVRAFAEALEMPELWDDLESMLRRPRPRRKGKGD
jgi:hypothetical protein